MDLLTTGSGKEMNTASQVDPLDFWWTEEILNEFFSDLDQAARSLPPDSSFSIENLAEPMPEQVKGYFDGDSNIAFRHITRIPCNLKCDRCGSIVGSNWLSKKSANTMNRIEKPYESGVCAKCYSECKTSLKRRTIEKWRHLIKAAQLHYWAMLSEPIELSFYESRQISLSFFGGRQDFYAHSWIFKSGFSALKNLIIRKIICFGITEECHLDVFFGEISVGTLSINEHRKMFIDWGMKHIQQMGLAASREEFSMSLKYREEIQMALAEASYYQLSYAIFRARKETSALWELQRRKRDITFKSALRETLLKLISGEWQVPSGSTFYADRDVPDNFWSLVRLKEHRLKNQEILSYPIGTLVEAIEADSVAHS